jgi:hypothetical protein
MKEALKQVSGLVDRFQQNIEAYRNPAYNETQLRIEFIDPFFEALGWDRGELRTAFRGIGENILDSEKPFFIRLGNLLEHLAIWWNTPPQSANAGTL